MAALVARLDHHFFLFFLHPVQIPDILIDPAVEALGLPRHVHRNKGVFLIGPVQHDENPADLQPASGNDIVLEAGVPDELLMHLRGVFDFIDVMAGFRFAQEIDGAVVVVIAEGRLADDGRAEGEMLRRPGDHGFFVRNPPSGQIDRHFLIGAEHPHRPVAKVISGVQPRLHLRRNDAQPGLVLVQPEHPAALHAAHKIGFGDRHGRLSRLFSAGLLAVHFLVIVSLLPFHRG